MITPLLLYAIRGRLLRRLYHLPTRLPHLSATFTGSVRRHAGLRHGHIVYRRTYTPRFATVTTKDTAE